MEQQQAKGSFLMRLVLSVSFLTASMVPLTTYAADGVLKGRVTDKTDGEGVVGASVVIPGTNIGTATDINGNFIIKNVPAKQQKVTVSIVGYAPTTQIVNVGDGQTATLNFALGQTTIMASEVVVGAALYKQDRLSIPVTANVVSKEKIKEKPNPTLDKIIDDIPGVVVTRAGGTAASGMQIRGSNTYQGGGIGTRVNAFYDGFPINSPETGEIVWQNINMNAADNVEVLKGSAATLYGSGAMGGVVNVTGHLPSTLEVKAGSSIGFYDAPPSGDLSNYRKDYTPVLWSSYAGVGNKTGPFAYSLLYSHSDDQGYRQNADYFSNDIKFKARYDIDGRQYVQVSAFYNQTKGGYAYYWPDDMHVFDLASKYWDDTIERKNTLIGINYVNLLSDRLSIDTRVYFTRNDSVIDYNKSNVVQGSPPFAKNPGDFNQTNSDRAGVGVKLDWKAADNHRLLFGLDANRVEYESTQAGTHLPVQNVLQTSGEKNFALFAQDEWKLTDQLTALLSARYDWNGVNSDTVTYRDYSNGTYHAYGTLFYHSPAMYTYDSVLTAPIANKSVSAFSPRIALNYKVDDELAFRASWGRSFRAPTLFERFVTDAGFLKGNPNPALDKETMTAYELGVFKKFGEKVSVDIAGFINDYDNMIESRYYGSYPYNAYFLYSNIGKARIWGIETSLNYRPTNTLSFNATYAYMSAKNLSYVAGADITGLTDANPDPSWLTYRPEHTASGSVTWKPTNKLTFNASGRYESVVKSIAMYGNKAGIDYPGDFVVFNAGVKYQFTKNISGTLVCNNINNTQYEEAEHFRAPGRSYVAGIDLTY